MEIWTRLIEGQNLKLRCRCFATFFCGDAVFVIFSFRGVAVWTVPQCPPPYYTINPYGTVIHSTHNLQIEKENKLVMHSNNVFQYSKIQTRKRNAKKSIKTVKNWNPALFGIRNPLCWNPESSTRNPESTAWNPESKNVLDSLTWGDPFVGRSISANPGLKF